MISEIDKYRLSSLTEVLCLMFSGTEFHNMVADRMKDFWYMSVLWVGITRSRGLRLCYGFLVETSGGSISLK